ncbi:PAS domain-containing protein [Terasakiella sp. A23]|uniref:PAS domain-containing protein n=1 Tax=Terasakiella sp. FCG-A23 TaxID=3080561 RepID=UPI002952D995|nr:PAS domain-containing protein [Terasakiella sp. A23]MDV7340681.1 PAS domain-containing protein [Terasakiella sp. A23]
MSELYQLSGNERTFPVDDIIVSKTDTKGIITYANDVFLKIADYKEHEVIGKPHKLIRHPEMPRCIFKLLWDTITAGEELFAYVLNQTKYGDYYWVLAHVTPTLDTDNNIIGFHSNRRAPNPEAIKIIQPLYRHLKQIEDAQSSSKEGLEQSFNMLIQLMEEQEMRYDMFMYKLQQLKSAEDFNLKTGELS